MKLPVVWMAAAFAAGIGLAGHGHIAPRLWIAAAIAAIPVGTALAWCRYTTCAWTLAMLG